MRKRKIGRQASALAGTFSDEREQYAIAATASPLPMSPVFSDVVAQELAKRAMVIAAVGEHSLLMVGSPGSGKSMLAQRLPSILPKLEGRPLEEALLIHSVAGESLGDLARGERPLRCPHHTVSLAGLVGGGRPVRGRAAA